MADDADPGPIPAPDPALRRARLQPLIGAWELTAVIGGRTVSGGRADFAWIEDGTFVMQRGAPPDPVFPSTTMLIGADDAREAMTILYADSRGVARVYQMSLEGGVWRMWRDAPGFSQRFRGAFSADGRTIAACWERSEDGATWEHDFDLTYARLD